MKIIFARHGKDDERYRGGWSSLDLTEDGVAQINLLADYLNKNKSYYNISHIVSSDLRRALSTSDILSEALSLPIITEENLREINNGDLAGMLNEKANLLYPDLYFKSLQWDEHYPNGESPKEFYNRIKNWLKDFIKQNQSNDKNILIVTHGGVINIIYHIASGIEWSNKSKSFIIPNASIHILNTDTMKIMAVQTEIELSER